MKVPGLIFSVLLIVSCAENAPLVAEIPTTSSCARTAMEQAESWSEKFKDTKILFKAKYKKFTEFQHASSPLAGYIQVLSNMPKNEIEPYLNRLASLCLYDASVKISRDDLGYRMVADELAKKIEAGISPIQVKNLGAEIELSYSAPK